MTEQKIEQPAKKGMSVAAQITAWTALIALLALVGYQLMKTNRGSIIIGEPVPDFTLQLYEGYSHNGQSEINLSDFRGKVILINFWASWCKPCEKEAAEIEAAWRHYEPTGQVIFLGISYIDTKPEAMSYLKKFDITYPNGPDVGTKITQLFRSKGVPETYIIDQNGILRFAKIGPFASVDEIYHAIEPLLEK